MRKRIEFEGNMEKEKQNSCVENTKKMFEKKENTEKFFCII